MSFHLNLPQLSGVYIIGCFPYHYIGSATNMRERCRRHWYRLRRGNHWSRRMQAEWNRHAKSGITDVMFTANVIKLVPDVSQLLHYEQFYLDGMFGPNNFNIVRTARRPRSPEGRTGPRKRVLVPGKLRSSA